MQEYKFWWDDANIDHIADHGVEPFEAEQVLANQPWIRRTREDKYVALGQANNGRFLTVIFARKARSRIRIVTARDMTASERSLYRKR
jgi:uncharacterized protein